MACACSLEARLKGGEGSRTALDIEKLADAGWSTERKGKSYAFYSPLPNRKRYKSSKEVVAYLHERGEYHLFCHCSCGQHRDGNESSELETEDEDYRPETEDETGVSSAYDDTPVKTHDQLEALRPMPKRLVEHIDLWFHDILYFACVIYPLSMLIYCSSSLFIKTKFFET